MTGDASEEHHLDRCHIRVGGRSNGVGSDRRWALIALDSVRGLDADSRTALTQYATGALHAEVGTIDSLVADVQAAVAVDREDFTL
jgi:hypothetical protein